MLPSSLGDTMRTVRDQAFFDVQALKRRVLPIGTCTYCSMHIYSTYIISSNTTCIMFGPMNVSVVCSSSMWYF
jgi:hypothetical protein